MIPHTLDTPGTLGIRFTGRSGSGFQPAMIRAHARACVLSVMPGNRCRSSIADDEHGRSMGRHGVTGNCRPAQARVAGGVWQSCGTRHGLRCRPRVTHRLIGLGGRARADLGATLPKWAAGDASGRTPADHHGCGFSRDVTTKSVR